ncbi:MAG TPA: adenosylcobinamide-GDP ribazoletransferase [Candidatus Binataceae bacterium]
MSDESGHGRATGGLEAPAEGLGAELRLAAGFLTIIPLVSARAATDETVAASFAWFPLVGFLLGATLCLEDVVLAPLFSQVLRSVLVLLTLTVVTGAVHLDALADSADALGAGRDRGRALEILRDSRIGSFGAVALFFALILKLLALSTLVGSRRYAALYLAPGFARWAMVAVQDGLAYLRDHGAGSTLLARAGRRNLVLATVTAIAAMLPVFSLQVFEAAATAAIVTIIMRAFYRRWLGGVTGDLIGACGELVEVAVLVAMSL